MSIDKYIGRLACRRRRKGITIAEIAETTCINARYLEAIEDRKLDQLPEGIYRRSYLRQYANAIDRRLAARLDQALQTEQDDSGPGPEAWLWRNPLVRSVAAAIAFLLPIEANPRLPEPAAETCPRDPRCSALAMFFQKYDSPLSRLSGVFLAAADQHGLDWRLLPGIAITETGGKAIGENKNFFGWDNGKAKFASIAGSIHYIASRLAKAPAYAGKATYSKLRAYNPARRAYPEKVMAVMRQIAGPEPEPAGE